MAKEIRYQGTGRGTVIRENELKVCDLCGHLNLVSNTECFVCGWHGHFETTPEVVHAAVELARRHNRLEWQHLTDPRTPQQASAVAQRSRVRLWLQRLWNWLWG